MEDLSYPFQFVQGMGKGKLLKYRGYLHYRTRTVGNIARYYCVKRKATGCVGKVALKDDTVVVEWEDHKHAPDEREAIKRKMNEELKNQVISFTSIKRVFSLFFPSLFSSYYSKTSKVEHCIT